MDMNDNTDTPIAIPLQARATPHPFPHLASCSAGQQTTETFIDQFAKQVAKTPDSIALVSDGNEMSYSELDARSNRLANFLNGIGISGGHTVILCVNPSVEMAIAFVGIWKAGAAYVPLDPDLPTERVRHIIEKTKAKTAIVDSETAKILTLDEIENLANLSDPGCPVWRSSELPSSKKPSPNDIAYVIYTSGSTGMPKGVAIKHSSVMDYLVGLVHHVPQFAQCRQFALGSPIYTDLGNTILYGSLINGSTLHLFTKERFNDTAYTKAYFKNHGIDCLKIVPSHWKFLSDGDGGLIPKRLLIFGGEKLPGALMRAVHRVNGECTVVNHYGPTETAIGKLLHVVEAGREYGHTIPIGKPFSNTAVYVLDEQLAHCPIGTPGELHIGGNGLAVEYIGEPTLTEKAFIGIPDINGDTKRLYKTGDVVRWLPDGNIEYIGRKDDQVKIRGNRIELAEIEHHLRALDGIRDAVVAVWEDTPDNLRLVAYVARQVLSEPAAELTQELIAAWKNELHSSLPHYMIPNVWMAIERIPLTANNKLDRKALPKPERRQQSEPIDDISTYSSNQRLAAETWSRVLGRESLGLDDDFFDLGGHSLLAMQALASIARETGLRLPIASLFRNPVLRDFAALLEQASRGHVHAVLANETPDGYTTSGSELSIHHIPLIDPQREIWLSCELGGEEANLAYNQSLTLELRGRLDIESMQRAVDGVVERHGALRARIDEGGEFLTIPTKTPVNLTVYEQLRKAPEHIKQSEFDAFVRNEMRRPFDLANGSLFRAFLHALGQDHHRLTIVVHHIICDAAAMRVLVRDIAALYNAHATGVPHGLPPAPQIGHYASAQLAFAGSGAHRATLDFWIQQHHSRETALDLPLDFKRPSTRTYAGGSAKQTLGTTAYQRVKALAAKASASIAATLTTIVEVFLHHRTGQNNITLGLTTAGQYITGHDEIVGHCVNLLPLRATIDPSQPFMRYLAERKDGIYTAYEHQRLTFSELLRELNLKRDRSHVPLIPFVITIQADGGPIADFNGLELSVTPNPRASHTFEIFLNINVDSQNSAIHLQWAYNTQLFSGESIGRMMRELELLVETVTNEPEVPVAKSLPLPHPFPEFENYTCDYPEGTTMVDHFIRQATDTPDDTALLFNGRKMTYAELDRRSNQLANSLAEMGVSPGGLVILCIRPSMEMIVAILGIWKAGAAYVPLDTDLPYERIRYIVGKTESGTIISDQETVQMMPLTEIGKVLALDDSMCTVWEASAERLTAKPSPHGMAYVIYTSGSTGNPKGVAVNHDSLVDYHFGLLQHLPQLAECRDFALGSPIYTDQGNTVHYAALTSGGRLHLFSKEDFNDPAHVGAYFREHRIDYLKIGPSRWKYLADAGAKLLPEKLLMFGGEALPPPVLHEVYGTGAACTVVNHYGPTETTIGKLLHITDPEAEYGNAVPIGKPFSNTRVLVLNGNGGNCPVGVPGELYIGGPGLASGYLAEPELTRQAFADIPKSGGQRFYRTGDIVRWLPGGDIEYVGRKDDQAKIRGNRIELGEIQNAVYRLNGVAKCVVLLAKGRSGENEIAAYTVQHPGAALDRDGAVAALRKVLPEYMVPRIWVAVPEIPLTPNGKVDKKALLKIEYQSERSSGALAVATTPTQAKLVEIWSECLTAPEIGVNEDFFELGGHSLAAVRVMAAIRRHFGLRLPLATLFEHPSIEKLAIVIDQGLDPMKWDCVIPIRPEGNRPPLFVVHGALLDVLYVRNLLPYLDPQQPLYGIQGMGLNDKHKAAHTIEEIAAHYVSEMLALTPDGPFALAGYSSGGVIAFEIAKQLKRRKKQVFYLGLFDTFTIAAKPSSPIKFWKAIFKEAFNQYGYKLSFLFLSFIFVDKIFQKTLAKISQRTYKNIFPFDYWKSKAQLVHMLAQKKYHFEPFEVNTILFKSPAAVRQQDHIIDQTNGWSALIKADLKVVAIEGTHFDMFSAEKVQDLGVKLQTTLNNVWDNYCTVDKNDTHS